MGLFSLAGAVGLAFTPEHKKTRHHRRRGSRRGNRGDDPR